AEVAARRAEHDHVAAGHVLAAVITDRFDDSIGTAVAHGEALTGHAPNVGFAAGGAIQADVADDDVVLGHERRTAGREYDEPPAGESLAQVIVGVAFEHEGHAARHERAEALTGRALELDADGVLGQSLRTVLAGDFASGDGSHDAVDVADRESRAHRGSLLDR